VPDRESNENPFPITEILAELREGRAGAHDELFRAIHGELRRIAAVHMRSQSASHTLQPTALVNEAYLKLMGGGEVAFHDRTHFLSTAARAMRQILIDHARSRGAARHGGGHRKQALLPDQAVAPGPNLDLIALDEALQRLTELSPERARVVELRFFGGLTNGETAEVLGVTERTVYRMWEFSRTWLHNEMTS
jgi:RNA polymerase sigma factor (TIGR02999 family)